MADLLLASQNPGKLEEMRLLAQGLPFRVLGPREIGLVEAPEETGASFLENARIKALAYARRSGCLTVADDSGLSVDALGGAPGLFSSRFGGEGASDLDRNQLLLEKLRGVPLARARRSLHERRRRGAGETPCSSRWRSSVSGFIAEALRGTNGFGYDPLFFYPPFGRTFGEVPRAEKDRVSHRGKAFARLRAFLAGMGERG